MLYLGTDNALYVSWDDGEHWTRTSQRSPAGADLLDAGAADVQRSRHRHAWARRLHARRRDAAAHVGRRAVGGLPPLRAAPGVPVPADQRRARKGVDAHVSGGTRSTARTSTSHSRSETPDVKVSITGPDNATIRTLTVAGHPGLNRVWWDLRYESGSTIMMQMPPLDEPWAPARRNYAAYGTRIPPAGPIVPPGSVHGACEGGHRREDDGAHGAARSEFTGDAADDRAQVAFVREVLAEIDSAAKMGNRDGGDAEASAGSEASIATINEGRGTRSAKRPCRGRKTFDAKHERGREQDDRPAEHGPKRGCVP